jgi:molecular chaperone DnaK
MRTLGIDLGTTNTAVALDGSILAQRHGEESSATLPSVVAFPPSGAVLVGPSAKKRRAIDPKNTIGSSKRVMGQGPFAYAAQKFKAQYPYDLVEKDGRVAFKTRSGVYLPTEIASRILTQALSALPFDPKSQRAVITVPAAFDKSAIDATVDAGRLAGIEDVRVLSEPVATAIAYLTTFNTGERVVAVYDLGGGTFDIALVDCGHSSPRVLAHAGDAYLGGDDVDLAIAEWATREVIKRFSWDLSSDALVRDRLFVQCERAKTRLGFVDRARIELAQVDPVAPCAGESLILDRAVVSTLADGLVGRTFGVCDEALRSAGLSVSDVGAVFLSGGSTLLTCIREGVGRYFQKLPRCEYDPMEVVAIGASLSNP